MKKFSLTFIIFLIIFTCIFIASATADSKNSEFPPNITPIANPHHSVIYCLGRGFANIGLGWIEIPHRMIYQGSNIPGFGLISGAAYGCFVTVWRALSGVTDLLSLGLGAGNAFFWQGMPDFPWNGPWIYEPPKPPPSEKPSASKITIKAVDVKNKTNNQDQISKSNVSHPETL